VKGGGLVDFKTTFAGQASREMLGDAGNFAYYAIGQGYIPTMVLDVAAGGYGLYGVSVGQLGKCRSDVYTTRYAFDWHRTNLTFVAGVLISNSSSGSSTSANFSQANQFYSINVDHAWRLPGADCVPRSRDDQTPISPKVRDSALAGYAFGRREYGIARPLPETPPYVRDVRAHSGWRSYKLPGINTYFI
jgi:hypothetical protein